MKQLPSLFPAETRQLVLVMRRIRAHHIRDRSRPTAEDVVHASRQGRRKESESASCRTAQLIQPVDDDDLFPTCRREPLAGGCQRLPQTAFQDVLRLRNSYRQVVLAAELTENRSANRGWLVLLAEVLDEVMREAPFPDELGQQRRLPSPRRSLYEQVSPVVRGKEIVDLFESIAPSHEVQGLALENAALVEDIIDQVTIELSPARAT